MMDCCETDDGQGKRDGFASRVLRYAYVDMMDDLAETLLLGLALAALAAAVRSRRPRPAFHPQALQGVIQRE